MAALYFYHSPDSCFHRDHYFLHYPFLFAFILEAPMLAQHPLLLAFFVFSY